MTKIANFALKIKRGGREGGTCKLLRPCPPQKKTLKRAPKGMLYFKLVLCILVNFCKASYKKNAICLFIELCTINIFTP